MYISCADNGFYLAMELSEDSVDTEGNTSTESNVSKHRQGMFDDIENTLGVQVCIYYVH